MVTLGANATDDSSSVTVGVGEATPANASVFVYRVIALRDTANGAVTATGGITGIALGCIVCSAALPSIMTLD